MSLIPAAGLNRLAVDAAKQLTTPSASDAIFRACHLTDDTKNLANLKATEARYRRMLLILQLQCGVPVSTLEEDIRFLAVELPDDRTIPWLLARRELVEGNTSVALNILRVASVDNTTIVQTQAQEAYERQDLATAVQLIGQMDALEDDASFPYAALAYDLACSIYRDAGMYLESTKSCLKLTTVAPKSGAAWLQLGSAYFAAQDYRNAVNAAEKAVALQEDNAWFREFLGQCYQAAGEQEKANEAFEMALRLDSTRDNARLSWATSLVNEGRCNEVENLLNAMSPSVRGGTDNILRQQVDALIMRCRESGFPMKTLH
jgi:tetratricopeptide (TPR) repeat protein